MKVPAEMKETEKAPLTPHNTIDLVYILCLPRQRLHSQVFHRHLTRVSEVEKKYRKHEPLKIIVSFEIQTLPKARVLYRVSRNTRPDSPKLSVRTLIVLW